MLRACRVPACATHRSISARRAAAALSLLLFFFYLLVKVDFSTCSSRFAPMQIDVSTRRLPGEIYRQDEIAESGGAIDCSRRFGWGTSELPSPPQARALAPVAYDARVCPLGPQRTSHKCWLYEMG